VPTSPVVTNVDPRTNPDAPTRGSSRLGKDEFLKLLMTQLGNQDPSSPTDSQAFVAQLATFTGLELQQASNDRLDALMVAQAAGNQIAAASMVGKTARFAADSVHHIEGPELCTLKIPRDVADSSVVITNSAGKVVRTLRPGSLSAGEHALAWDGLDDAGIPVPAGDYSIKASASDADKKPVDVAVLMEARIEGVSYANGFPELLVNGGTIHMGDVVEIRETRS